jgi:hypothetical protein
LQGFFFPLGFVIGFLLKIQRPGYIWIMTQTAVFIPYMTTRAMHWRIMEAGSRKQEAG